MSANKDVEKMYRQDAEKRKKNQKKKKKNRLMTLIIVILMIVGLLLLMNYLGFGFGFGDGEGKNGDNDNNDKSVSVEDAAVSEEEKDESREDSSEESSSSEESAAVVEFVDITVAGSAYITGGNVTELEAFIDTVGKMNENVIVKITDDNATQNAMEDLKNALTEKDRKFVIMAKFEPGESGEEQDISEEVE